MAGGERNKHKRRSRGPSYSPRRKHKHRNRSRSRSPRGRPRSRSRSASSESLSDNLRLKEKKSTSKDERKKERKREKDLIKAMETPEEKRARRLAKKEAKDRKRRQESGWDEENLGYTNTDNPFGDAHLLEAFVWHKKREKEGNKRASEEEHRRKEKMRQEETRAELEKVRRRRKEREQEMLMRDEEREKLQREKEAEYYKEWEQQEDTFHLEQAKLRSKIRIKDGRAKPIDLLAKYINDEEEDLDIQMHEPYTILVGLRRRDIEDLLEDIKVYMELEQSKNTEFWKDMTIICKDELRKLRKADSRSGERVVDRRESINSSVQDDVAKVFRGKTYSQLIALEKQIHQKITSGDAVDIGYWESLLGQIKAYMAKARLREKHQAMLKDKLLQLQQQKSQLLRYSSDNSSESESEPEPEKQDEPEGESKFKDEEEEKTQGMPDEAGMTPPQPIQSVYSEEDLIEEGYTAYEEGSYSPKLIKTSDVDEAHIRDPSEDWTQLEILRQEVLSGGGVTTALQRSDESVDAAAMLQKEASKGMQADEEAFNVPIPLTQKAYLWQDKYRPRKPRFFNRVHTGYEWNKYNQTHYDSDNPPPKIVQGYKFNIFYPDLIDKTKAPEYILEPCKDNKEFGILRFHAGPPYEDIAFKIVNREWEYSHRHGFRCQFQNNNFQLWFHFKRYRYRR